MPKAGTRVLPRALASATAAPDTADSPMAETMVTCANPPRTRPMMRLANSIRRSMIPPATISSPVSIKKGMAISGKLFTECIMRWGSMLRSISLIKRAPSEEKPRENASGMPARASRKNMVRMMAVIPFRP